MKLDTKALRYLTVEDWKVLAAVEQGSKNHEVVPTPLIAKLSGLRGGSGVHKCISNLAKVNLIARLKNAKYDGYRLTYGGLDYLALHTHQKQKAVYSVGNQIGIGKESDIFVVASPAGVQHVLKVHRLGRISFRTVKANRDYLRHRSSGSWMYMSRLAALKEFTFMKALRENGFAVPEPIAQSRHTIVMSLIDAFPLRQITEVPDPAGLYGELMEMILRLAKYGLIHGDFNEFNILIEEKRAPVEDQALSQSANEVLTKESLPTDLPPTTEKASPNLTDGDLPNELEPINISPLSTSEGSLTLTPILIDFPQMVSIDHANAAMYFDRDVSCIKRFFERRFHFTSDEPGPFFADAKKLVGRDGVKRLDVAAEASGFSKKMAKELEAYMREVGVDGDGIEATNNGDGVEEFESDGGSDGDQEETTEMSIGDSSAAANSHIISDHISDHIADAYAVTNTNRLESLDISDHT